METPKASLAEYFFGTVTVGERGQVVIPVEARRQFGIESGDKLLVFSHPLAQSFSLVKIDAARDVMEKITTIIGHPTAGSAEEDTD